MESFIAQIIVGLATGGIYALLVLGMNLLVLVRNIVHHSYSHIVVLTMAMGWLTLTHTGNNIPLCIVVMLVSAIVFTIATEPLFRPLSVRGADLETVTLAMGIGIIITEFISKYINGGANFAFPDAMTGRQNTINIGLISFSAANIVTLVCCAVVAVALMWFLFKSKEGRAIRAMAQNLRVARMLGIPFGRTGVLGFGIAGLLAGIIAILCIMTLGAGSPALGDTFAVKAIILMLFAGMGNLKGGLLSALFMGVVEAMALAYLPGRWTEAVFYGVIKLVIIWKPNGLFGKQH